MTSLVNFHKLNSHETNIQIKKKKTIASIQETLWGPDSFKLNWLELTGAIGFSWQCLCPMSWPPLLLFGFWVCFWPGLMSRGSPQQVLFLEKDLRNSFALEYQWMGCFPMGFWLLSGAPAGKQRDRSLKGPLEPEVGDFEDIWGNFKEVLKHHPSKA